MTFKPEQINALAAKLDGSAVKQRSQAGRQFSYIEGWHAIAEANRIFGFDGWCRETVDIHQLGEPREVDGKWRVAYMARVRVTVFADYEITRDGCGYGSGIDRDLGSAHESALKEAETDAMKRALMTFGNPFGLALYDKDQSNVEKPDAAPKAEAQKKSAPAPDAVKAIAESLAGRIKTAPTIAVLDNVMDDARADFAILPRVTIDFLNGLYEKRKAYMREPV
jgi:DNA repair and recombination protein RAD52